MAIKICHLAQHEIRMKNRRPAYFSLKHIITPVQSIQNAISIAAIKIQTPAFRIAAAATASDNIRWRELPVTSLQIIDFCFADIAFWVPYPNLSIISSMTRCKSGALFVEFCWICNSWRMWSWNMSCFLQKRAINSDEKSRNTYTKSLLLIDAINNV